MLSAVSIVLGAVSGVRNAFSTEISDASTVVSAVSTVVRTFHALVFRVFVSSLCSEPRALVRAISPRSILSEGRRIRHSNTGYAHDA